MQIPLVKKLRVKSKVHAVQSHTETLIKNSLLKMVFITNHEQSKEMSIGFMNFIINCFSMYAFFPPLSQLVCIANSIG